jgi:hypothetical protein
MRFVIKLMSFEATDFNSINAPLTNLQYSKVITTLHVIHVRINNTASMKVVGGEEARISLALKGELEYRYAARTMAYTHNILVNGAARRPVAWRKPEHAVRSV